MTMSSKPAIKSPPCPSLWFLLQHARDNLLEMSDAMMQKHGGLVQFKGAGKTFLVSDPAWFRHISITHKTNYRRDSYGHYLLGTVLGHGLTVKQDEPWQRTRRLLNPVFSPSSLERLSSIVSHELEELLNSWALQSQPIDALANMMHLTLSIAAGAFFNLDIKPYAKKLLHRIAVVNEYAGNINRFAAKWRPTWRNIEFRYQLAAGNRLIRQFMRQHQPNQPPDILDLLRDDWQQRTGHINEDDLVGELKTFLVTGHETTGTVLSFALYHLAQMPEWQHAIAAEVASHIGSRLPQYADLEQLHHTRAVFNETLRLYPPIWAYPRSSVAQDQDFHHIIPASSTMWLCPYTLHRNPSYWQDPYTFNPTRFLTSSAMSPLSKSAFLPFGTGEHRCIGANFALMEGIMILAAICQRFTLSLPKQSQNIKPINWVTLRPEKLIYVNIAPKQ